MAKISQTAALTIVVMPKVPSGILIDTSRAEARWAVAYLAPRLPQGFVDDLATRLQPYKDDVGSAAATLARELLDEAARIIAPDTMVYAGGMIGTGVELAARRVAGSDR